MTTTISRQNDAGSCAHTLLSIGSISSLGCLDVPMLLTPPPPSRGSTAGASRQERLETEPILSIDRSRGRPRLRI